MADRIDHFADAAYPRDRAEVDDLQRAIVEPGSSILRDQIFKARIVSHDDRAAARKRLRDGRRGRNDGAETALDEAQDGRSRGCNEAAHRPGYPRFGADVEDDVFVHVEKYARAAQPQQEADRNQFGIVQVVNARSLRKSGA